LVPHVAAHGQIAAAMANGQTVEGPNVYYAADAKNAATVVSVMYQASGTAYNKVSDFGDNAAMSCESASAPPASLTVTSGSTVRVYWEGATSELLNQAGVDAAFNNANPWVHAMGTVAMDIADCGGDCSSADPASLSWNRIYYWGLDTSQSISDGLRQTMTDKPEPYYPQGVGLWGMAALVARGSWVEATIPQDLVAGNYMVRTELAAVHSPGAPQVYIGCVATKVEGSGTTSLTGGTQAGSLYSSSGPLATFDVYSGSSWTDDGPALLSIATQTASGGSGSSGSSSSSSDSSSSGSSDSSSGSSSGDSSSGDSSSSEVDTPTTTSDASAAATTSASCRRRRRSLEKKRSVPAV
ncbi:hypothetical protein BDZ89DRAFT_926598, partial [Hymenopellis radicata]